MRQALKLHPDSPPTPAGCVEAEALRPAPGRLRLRFRISGGIGDLVIPSPAIAARVDELWKHTCLEAFVRLPDGQAYLEFNLSPSGQWAAYYFSGYRAGMAPLELLSAPRIMSTTSDDQFHLEADLDLAASGLPETAPWQVALTAVIEAADDSRSYWALAHPPGKPDFHHPDGFVLTLPPAETA